MLGLEVVVGIGVAVLVGSLVARRTGLAAPVVLIAAGLVLSAVPALRRVGLPSDAVLLLFLPALLFWESLTTSSREIRRNLRGIVISGTLLVIATAAVVAVVGRALGLSWSTSWIIGAAVAPTDATAVAALGRVLPRRQMTVLRAESLINDGTALVVFALALEYALGEEAITVPHVTWLFARSLIGGVAVGLVVGGLVYALRRRIVDPMLSSVALVVTPFAAYLLAEEIHGSGVLAVVTSGLVMAQLAPRVVSAATRQQSTPFWTLSSFLLNAALFVLIGLQLPSAIGGLSSAAIGRGFAVMVVVYVAVIVARFGFLHLSIYTVRLLDRRPSQRLRRTTFRGRLVQVVAGFRGAVSLAVALATPVTLTGRTGTARDMVVFVTAGVVVLSLVIQGAALPRLVRWAALPDDTSEHDELELARRTASESALAELPALAEQAGVDEAVTAEVRTEIEHHLHDGDGDADEDEESDPVRHRRQYLELKLALLGHKRSTMIRLRDEQVIDDTVLRQLQSHLDIEEVRLRGPQRVE